MRLAILASGEGSTLQALLDAYRNGMSQARVVLVISNNADSGALRRATEAGVPHRHLSSRTHPEAAALDLAILEALEASEAQIVLLSRYVKRVGPVVLSRYAGRILNTHPSLLPRHGGQGMYGARVHDAVLASGDRESGVSVHHVNEEYDEGPVLFQQRVPVLPGDTSSSLAARVQEAERAALVTVLNRLAEEQRTSLGADAIHAGPNPSVVPLELTTPRLRLRRGRPSDAPALFTAYTGSEERSRYLVRGVHTRIEQTEGFLRTWCDARWGQLDASFAWVLADLATDEPIGTFVVVRQGHIAEVHFGLARARSGQGLATEALIAVTQWLETLPVIQRIWTACDVEHLASQAVLAHAGFRPEGVLRKWLVLPAFGADARDCVAFARVRERPAALLSL